MAIADGILQQLGGRRFIVMTGAKNVMSDKGGSALVFQLPRRLTKNGINAVRIELDPSDTYTMNFFKIGDARNGYKRTTISEFSDVSADQLREIFESVTGLATSLGTMGRRSGDRRRQSRGTKRSSRGSKRRSRR